ncbi:MAG TPA: sulfur oxidation c-type cytochrome SoxX [Casimicrobiaceae bacterium]
MIAGLVAIVAIVAPPAVAQSPAVVPYAVAGDAIVAPLTRTPGVAARGRAIVADRQVGMCLLCHRGPIPEERSQGTIGPDLAGVGARLGAGQLRLRIVDMRRVNPASTMPAYHRIEGLERVAPAWTGKPILDAQQVEDVVAYLGTLRP